MTDLMRAGGANDAAIASQPLIEKMTAMIHGTIRTMDADVRKNTRDRVEQIAHGIAAAHDVKAVVTLNEGYPVVMNHETAVERFLTVARQTVGEEFVSDNAYPTMGGEDFAFYGESVLRASINWASSRRAKIVIRVCIPLTLILTMMRLRLG